MTPPTQLVSLLGNVSGHLIVTSYGPTLFCSFDEPSRPEIGLVTRGVLYHGNMHFKRVQEGTDRLWVLTSCNTYRATNHRQSASEHATKVMQIAVSLHLNAHLSEDFMRLGMLAHLERELANAQEKHAQAGDALDIASKMVRDAEQALDKYLGVL